MSPSALFILRPVATTLLMAAILMVGIVAYRFLPISALPEVDYPTIQVQTFYPGASPEVMTSSVTSPLEVQFGQMPSLNQMFSTSSAGASMITLQFTLDVSLDVAEQEVQAAINAAGNLLPSDLPAPPIYAKVNPADAPILTLALTSKTLPLTQVEDMADTRLAQKISQQPGVGLVSISGGQRPAVRVQINPRALAAYGLNIDDLRTTLGNANVNTPKGNFDGPAQATTINANDQITDPQQYLDLVIAYRNGAPVRLKDVATVVNGAENSKLEAWANKAPAVILNVQRQPGANVIQVVDNIKKLLPQLQTALPAAVDVAVLTDRTTTIRASVSDVEFELGLAVVLVVLVIFLFLRNVPATIIPSLSVPLSLVGTLAVMYLFGFSLDNLSLMALTISTGFVVDDAIVMIENISRYVEAGEAPLAAALKGSGQIGFTIISLTVSLIAVLIPLLFMGDVVGRLFHEFAITLSVTIIISAVVSLTLVPMMCAKLLRHRPEAARSKWDLKADQGFNWVIGQYDRALKVVLAHQPLTLARRAGHTGHHRVALHRRAEGLLPGAGYRGHPGHFGRRANRVLQGDGGASAGAGGGNPEGSGRRQPELVHWRRRQQHDAEQRPLPDQPEAEGRPQPQRHRCRSAAAAGNRRGHRRIALSAAGAGPVGRCRGQPHAVPVRAGKPISGRLQRMGAETRGAAGSLARPGQRRQRPAAAGPDRQPGDRPGNRGALRHHARHGGQRAVRPVRPAHHLHDLHAVQPVPRDHGGGSGAADLARCTGRDLPAVRRLHHRTGAAQRHRQGRAEARAIADQPSGAVPGDDDFVRYRARILAGRRGHRDPPGGNRHRPAEQLRHRLPGRGGRAGSLLVERTAAGAGGNRYRLHRAGRAVRKLHPSRSPSSPPCPRPAPARWWRCGSPATTST